SVDIARCTQIARRRKLDMVAALAAATESPQVPPEARERIRVFLKLYRSGAGAIDTTRPDLYVHRLVERLGLRRQQLFAAQADVVERLRALAHLTELAGDFVRRRPQATARELARSLSTVAEAGLGEDDAQELSARVGAVRVLAMDAARRSRRRRSPRRRARCSAPSGRPARRSSSARPRRCTQRSARCATSCSATSRASAPASANCASTPTSTSRTRWCATSSSSSSGR